MHTEHSLVLLPIISYPYCRSARCKPACGGDVWECQGCLNQKWRWRFVFAVVLTNFTSALGLGGPSWASIMKIWQSSLCFWNRCFSIRRGWVIVFWVFRAQKTQNMTDLQLPYTAVNFFGGKSLPLGLLWCQNFCFWGLCSLQACTWLMFKSLHWKPFDITCSEKPFSQLVLRFHMEFVLQYFPEILQLYWKRCPRFLPIHIKIIYNSVHESASYSERWAQESSELR